MRSRIIDLDSKVSYLEDKFGSYSSIEPHYPKVGSRTSYLGHVAITKSLTPSKKTEYTIKLALPKSDIGMHPVLSKVGTRRAFRAYMMILFFMMREGSGYDYVEDSYKYPNSFGAGKDKLNRLLVGVPDFNDTVASYERESLSHFKRLVDLRMGGSMSYTLLNSERLPYYLNPALSDPRELDMDAIVDISAEVSQDFQLRALPSVESLLNKVNLPHVFDEAGLRDIYGIFENFFGNLKILTVTGAENLVTVESRGTNTTVTLCTDGLDLYDQFYYVCVGLSYIIARKATQDTPTTYKQYADLIIHNRLRSVTIGGRSGNRLTRIWSFAYRLSNTVLASMAHHENSEGLLFIFREIIRLRVQYEGFGKASTLLPRNFKSRSSSHDEFKLRILRQTYPHLEVYRLPFASETLAEFTINTFFRLHHSIGYRRNLDIEDPKSDNLIGLYTAIALYLEFSDYTVGDSVKTDFACISSLTNSDVVIRDHGDGKGVSSTQTTPLDSDEVRKIMKNGNELSRMDDITLSWLLVNGVKFNDSIK